MSKSFQLVGLERPVTSTSTHTTQTNWKLYIICQEEKSESLTSPSKSKRKDSGSGWRSYARCCSKCSDFMSSSCAGAVGSSQEGVGRSRRCNLILHQGLYPATSSQPVAERLQGGHLDVEPTEHHYHLVFTILLWPLPLNLLCQGKQ